MDVCELGHGCKEQEEEEEEGKEAGTKATLS